MANTKAVDLVNLKQAMSENNKKLKQYVDAIEIPTKVSELVNDKGYLTEFTETDPTVPAWAKAEQKPKYTASEVGADAAGTASSAVSTHDASKSAHNDIRLLIEGLTTRLNAALNSEDVDLDQMAEIVAYIKSNRSIIEAVTTSKVSVTDIVNNLDTDLSNRPLSAAQGVAIKNLLDELRTQLDTKETVYTALSEINLSDADFADKDFDAILHAIYKAFVSMGDKTANVLKIYASASANPNFFNAINAKLNSDYESTSYTMSRNVAISRNNNNLTVIVDTSGTTSSDKQIACLAYANSSSITVTKFSDTYVEGGFFSAKNPVKLDDNSHVTGALPIAKGGTGATTASDALVSLGAAADATHNVLSYTSLEQIGISDNDLSAADYNSNFLAIYNKMTGNDEVWLELSDTSNPNLFASINQKLTDEDPRPFDTIPFAANRVLRLFRQKNILVVESITNNNSYYFMQYSCAAYVNNAGTTIKVSPFVITRNDGGFFSKENKVNLEESASNVTGILPVANGGTGASTAKDALNSLIAALGVGDTIPVDEDYYISQKVGGGDNQVYYRRPMKFLWNYISNKISTAHPALSYLSNVTSDIQTQLNTIPKDVASTTADGLAPKLAGGTTKFLRADGTWAVPPDTNTVYTHPSYTAKSSGLYKVTVDATGHVSAVANVTKADITGLGIPAQDTTYSTFVKSGSGAKAGLVPAPSTTAGTTKYLREDGTWAVPPDTNTTYTAATATPLVAGTAAVGTSSKYAREDHVHPAQTDITGNAKNVTGVVAIANGGTGKTTAKEAVNALFAGVPTGTSTGKNWTDEMRFIAENIAGDGTYYTRTMSDLWVYIKKKIVSDTDGPVMTGASSSEVGVTGLVPAPEAGKQAAFLRGDGTWATPTNTTYSTFVKSGSSAAAGLVPKPSTTAGTTKFLCENGTWAVPPDTNTVYTHPSYTAKSSGLYKITVDATGHVSAATAVAKSDITGLGIPAQDTTYSAATTSAAGLLSAEDKTKLDGIAAGANKYSHPTTAGNKHIPTGGAAGQILKWSASGTAVWGDEKDTTYSTMGAASSSAAGTAGLVPAPAAGKQTAFLRGDGTWVVPTNTTYSAATTSAAGLMSATDKTKLDGINAEISFYKTLGGIGLADTDFVDDAGALLAEKAAFLKIYDAMSSGEVLFLSAVTATSNIGQIIAAKLATDVGETLESAYNIWIRRIGYGLGITVNPASYSTASTGYRYCLYEYSCMFRRYSASTQYIGAFAPSVSPEGGYVSQGALDNLNAKTIQINLASASAAALNSGSEVTPGVTGILPVANGGTGRATLTSGYALVGNGTNQVSLRNITNITATSTTLTANTNLITANTLKNIINRTSSVAAGDTSYTTLMARGTSLNSSSTTPAVNGAIAWTYK